MDTQESGEETFGQTITSKLAKARDAAMKQPTALA
jgi:hypothetical protein